MQHQSAHAVVDNQTCADAISDIPQVLLRLWGRNALNNLRHWHRVALRIVRLYSCNGEPVIRQQFEDAMRRETWRSAAERRNPRINEVIVEAGYRGFWGIPIKRIPAQVEQILNAHEIP